MKNSLFLTILLFSFVSLYAQKTLVPTDAGSKVHFVIRNFGINTGGDLAGLKGTIKVVPNNPASSSIDVTVQAGTVDTDNEKRDAHLKTDDYFDVAKYPTIHLVSTKISASSTPGSYIFTGNLTIKAVTKAITFPFTTSVSNGASIFAGEFSINRLDYGVGKESATMSDDVKVQLTVAAK
jgi:polyisoprenoid-binding protein YceI